MAENVQDVLTELEQLFGSRSPEVQPERWWADERFTRDERFDQIAEATTIAVRILSRATPGDASKLAYVQRQSVIAHRVASHKPLPIAQATDLFVLIRMAASVIQERGLEGLLAMGPLSRHTVDPQQAILDGQNVLQGMIEDAVARVTNPKAA